MQISGKFDLDFRYQSALTHSGFEREQHNGNLKLPAAATMTELLTHTFRPTSTPPLVFTEVKYFEIWPKFGFEAV